MSRTRRDKLRWLRKWWADRARLDRLGREYPDAHHGPVERRGESETAGREIKVAARRWSRRTDRDRVRNGGDPRPKRRHWLDDWI